jgi:hypothetical protein
MPDGLKGDYGVSSSSLVSHWVGRDETQGARNMKVQSWKKLKAFNGKRKRNKWEGTQS